MRIVLCTKVDVQSDKLTEVVCRTSAVASIFNQFDRQRPLVYHTERLYLRRTKMTTCCDDRRAGKIFSESLFFKIPEFPYNTV